MLPELLKQSGLDQQIATVTADGAYDTRACHDAIADWGAAALAIVLEPCMDGPLARALFGSGIPVGRGHVCGV